MRNKKQRTTYTHTYTRIFHRKSGRRTIKTTVCLCTAQKLHQHWNYMDTCIFYEMSCRYRFHIHTARLFFIYFGQQLSAHFSTLKMLMLFYYYYLKWWINLHTARKCYYRLQNVHESWRRLPQALNPIHTEYSICGMNN